MSDRLILVDTSAWITYLRSETGAEPYPLHGLGQNDFLATNSLIRVELLSGAADEGDYRVLEHQLSMLRDVALNESVWAYAARLRWTLCRKGLTIPVADIVIASSAIVQGCEMLYEDRHFDLIAKHAPLRVYAQARARKS